MLLVPANSAARAVLAEPGPISKMVHADITDTAVSRLTPNPTKIGKMEATNNNPKPVALGVQMNNICPIGITTEAAT